MYAVFWLVLHATLTRVNMKLRLETNITMNTSKLLKVKETKANDQKGKQIYMEGTLNCVHGGTQKCSMNYHPLSSCSNLDLSLIHF